MKDVLLKCLTPLIAILGIVAMELVAISHGIDGKVLTLSCVLVAGIGGYTLKNVNFSQIGTTIKTLFSRKANDGC